MPFHVRDPETDALVRQYAEEKRVGITDAIKLAVTKAREADEKALAQKRAALKAIRDEVAAWPRTGEVADKAFFDSLNDE
ncbi:type II toxin-antitoxin system VapB family antitoxin [Caulobacter sp. SSI4214]|uniref:type II toxin-antitoxin system VapB family antitoxin n=1 Tax=Caulobacter sp. SSI4214 TaxID=2575739 RepID=UPI00143ABA0C|nr:type II toxin-antitoxin system VapB family antitoxin [Caulobacter sp. SSI4214]